jgi:N-acetyl sugar amidotransferase
MTIRYCQRCILPDTRPGLVIAEDGICGACRSHSTKTDVDWSVREQMFRDVVANAQSRAKGCDCLIPVSGGKDSTWQVAKCLEYGLKPLALTWRPPLRTEIGQRNLENLISLGVDHIDYQISPEVERRFVYEGLCRYGSSAIPMHMAIFNIPLRMAERLNIPLVVMGENSSAEYIGGDNAFTGFELTPEWVRRFGVTHGTTAEDWVSETLTRKDLTPYFGPDAEALKQADVRAIFLGYYFAWDPEKVFEFSKQRGFCANPGGARVGLYDYADIDDDAMSVHHWFKWHKFGFTRLWDNLALENRNGRLSRDEAIRIVRETGDQTPHGDIAKLCEWLRIPVDRLFEIAESYRDPRIWNRRDGHWMIDGFLIDDWQWEKVR